MIDFTKLTGIEHDGKVVTQITDASGRVLWSVRGTKVVLTVKKWTDTTYAGETEREGEVFIAFDIYPNPYGVVKVTYNGHTKTITDTTGASEPNAQTVYFGTLYGESDGVEILESATLTIEGGFKQFAVGSYTKKGKTGGLNSTGYCGCVTSVIEWGNITRIANYAFDSCASLTSITIPDGVTSISPSAFDSCTGLTSISIPNGVISIGYNAFIGCTNLQLTSIPSGVTTIDSGAFSSCYGLKFSDNFLNEGLVTIGSNAFDMSTSDLKPHAFESITIPSTVTEIGAHAFRGPIYDAIYAGMFKRIVMKPKIPPTLNITSSDTQNPSSVFGASVTTVRIIVPKGCLDAYKTANIWSVWGDNFEEEP